jgi:phosphoserine phosphatase
VNQKILHIVQDNTSTTILATAAPLLYAQGIKEKYHFDFVIATANTIASPWQENIREIKAKNVKNLFNEKNLDTKDAILYTDHHDDMPLMNIVSLTYLVNSENITIDILKGTNINFTLF